MNNIVIREPTREDADVFIEAMKRSQSLHHPWVKSPQTPQEFNDYFQRYQQPNQKSYLAIDESGDFAGVFNINEIVRGLFQNAYLGFYAVAGYEEKGYMSAGLKLVLEIVTQKLGVEKIGAHIAETKARIDFVYDKNISSFLEKILAEYNEIIRRDEPIKTDFSDVDSQRRYWEIEDFSKVPCGGTHVKSTAEVGFVTLKRVNIGGGKERVEIRLVDDSVSVTQAR